MAGLYVDTSALGRLLLAEPDAPAIRDELRGFERHLASRLLRIELHRLALRHGLSDEAEELLGAVGMVPLDETILAAAESVAPSSVATLDAIHLLSALRLAEAELVDSILTYDVRLAGAAREHGLPVLAPA